MCIDKRNSEGYPDPTAYEALSLIEKEERALRAFRPIVYICSPYAGDIEKNVKAARDYCRFAVDKGFIPVAPHLLFPQFMDDTDPQERDIGIILWKCPNEQMLRSVGYSAALSLPHAGRNQKSQVEKLPPALLHRRFGGGTRCLQSLKVYAASAA
jgi:hypothetical protein